MYILETLGIIGEYLWNILGSIRTLWVTNINSRKSFSQSVLNCDIISLCWGRVGRVLAAEEQLGEELGRGGLHEDGQGPRPLRAGNTLRHSALLSPPGLWEVTLSLQLSLQSVSTTDNDDTNILVKQELSLLPYWSIINYRLYTWFIHL